MNNFLEQGTTLFIILFVIFIGVGGLITYGDYLIKEMEQECLECGVFTYCNETINQGNLSNQELCNKLWIDEKVKSYE